MSHIGRKSLIHIQEYNEDWGLVAHTSLEEELSHWLYSQYRGEDIKPIIEIFKKHGWGKKEVSK